jgi:hypothetical protein
MSSGRDQASRIPAARQPAGQKNYPLLHVVFLAMTGLLIGTFSFFGLHTLAWLVRAVTCTCTTQNVPRGENQDAGRRRMVHALRAVRAVPAFPRGDELPAAGRHRHAAEILLHRLGEIHFRHHRRAGNGAHAAPFRRAHHVPLFRRCT